MTELLLCSFGPKQVLAEDLAGLPGIEQIYLFGSWAVRYTGQPGRPPADIDVLVIGAPDRDDLDDAAQRASARLAHDGNLTIRSAEWWLRAPTATTPRGHKPPTGPSPRTRCVGDRGGIVTWQPGKDRITELLAAGELAQVTSDDAVAKRLISDSARHLDTAAVATSSGDLTGAINNCDRVVAMDAFDVSDMHTMS
jgi:hypothetical protein